MKRPVATDESAWVPDILGPGFRSLTLPLHADDEGEVVCTLVQYLVQDDPQRIALPEGEPKFSVLYLHGWNDYFFQRELARQWAVLGANFYALDLRKYGRSLRPHQSFGYVDSLEIYDEDMHAAMRAIRELDRAEVGSVRPLVLCGHSTGGLTAALWADRHPGALAGLILNAPWLDLSENSSLRTISHPVVERIAAVSPLRPLPLSSGPNFYGMSLKGWLPEDGPLPLELENYADDPAVVGWGTNPEWKNPQGAITRAGWFNAILNGHERVAEGLDITCPILVQMSVESIHGDTWDPIMRRQDAALEVEVIAERAVTLGRSVSIFRYEAKHDVILSDPLVRLEVWEDLFKWAPAFLRSKTGSSLCAVPKEPAVLRP